MFCRFALELAHLRSTVPVGGTQEEKWIENERVMCEGDELTTWQEIYHCWSVYVRPYGDGYSREITPFGRIDYLLNNFTVLWVGFTQSHNDTIKHMCN